MKLLLTTLLLPLGLALVLAAAGWYALFVRNTKRALWLVGISVVVLYAFSTPWVGRNLGMVLLGMVEGRSLAEGEQVDAIVVLTAGMTNAGSVGWIPSHESFQRLAVAYEAQRIINLRLPVIVSGGYTRGVKAPSEAAVAAGFFARHRPEITPTELEEASTDTYESAMQLAPVLAKRAARNVMLVTDEAHMLRALATYRARGVDAIPFPVLTLPTGLGIRDFLPSPAGLKLSSDAVYEVCAVLAYLLSGKVGWGDVFYQTTEG
jgi:uncharacterized SAM-binding protein YcdF (DUF218 family)